MALLVVVALVVGSVLAAVVRAEPRIEGETRAAVCRVLGLDDLTGCVAPDAEPLGAEPPSSVVAGGGAAGGGPPAVAFREVTTTPDAVCTTPVPSDFGKEYADDVSIGATHEYWTETWQCTYPDGTAEMCQQTVREYEAAGIGTRTSDPECTRTEPPPPVEPPVEPAPELTDCRAPAGVQVGGWEDSDDVDGVVGSEYRSESGLCAAADGVVHQCTRVVYRAVAPDGTRGPENAPLWTCDPAPADTGNPTPGVCAVPDPTSAVGGCGPAESPEAGPVDCVPDPATGAGAAWVTLVDAVAGDGAVTERQTRTGQCVDLDGGTRECQTFVDRQTSAAGAVTYGDYSWTCGEPVPPLNEADPGSILTTPDCSVGVGLTPEAEAEADAATAAMGPRAPLKMSAQIELSEATMIAFAKGATGLDPSDPAQLAELRAGFDTWAYVLDHMDPPDAMPDAQRAFGSPPAETGPVHRGLQTRAQLCSYARKALLVGSAGAVINGGIAFSTAETWQDYTSAGVGMAAGAVLFATIIYFEIQAGNAAAVVEGLVSTVQTLQTQLALTNAVVGQMAAAQQGAGGQEVGAAELGQAVDALYQEGVAQLSPGTPPVQMGPLFPTE